MVSGTRTETLTNKRRTNITTTLFVPTSRNSILFRLICERERVLSKKMDWSVKILKQAGTPLLNKFIYKFPIVEGCPKEDTCNLCENDMVRCFFKGSIYRAYCEICQKSITGFTEGLNIPTYVGDRVL